VTMICKDNDVNSERMGFLLLKECSEIEQLSLIKPLIASIH
jgi:hypothetical protein